LFGKTGVFLHPIVQATCFKKLVESLNSCQTNIRQKGLFFHTIVQALSRQILKELIVVANNLSKFLPELKNLSDISQAISP
jgi:hypothetical protein